MVIQHICIRCRHVSGGVEIQGGNPFLLEMTMIPMMSRGLCMRCGGWVYAVKEDEVLPYEFVPTWRRVMVASGWLALKVPFLFLPFAFIITLPKQDYSNLINEVFQWVWIFLGIAAAIGVLLPWGQSFIAQRLEINEPHPAGAPSIGEAATMFNSLLPLIVITALIFYFVPPILAGADIEFRSGIVRILCGLFVGFVLTGMSSRELFRYGRRPPPEGKKWYLGEKPK